MRVPPIVWAGVVAVVVLGLAIAFGLLTGPGPQPACTSGPGVTTAPTACATVPPSAGG
jgi:hypothetical protein